MANRPAHAMTLLNGNAHMRAKFKGSVSSMKGSMNESTRLLTLTSDRAGSLSPAYSPAAGPSLTAQGCMGKDPFLILGQTSSSTCSSSKDLLFSERHRTRKSAQMAVRHDMILRMRVCRQGTNVGRLQVWTRLFAQVRCAVLSREGRVSRQR